MINLGLMLTAYTATGGYAVAGAVTGAYSATVAFAAPVWGRMVDRRGPRWTLAFTVSLQTAAFAAFAGIAKKVFAQVDDPQSKRATFAMSGLFAEIVFVLGPLAIGGIVILVEPMYAVIVTAVISLGGVLRLRGASAVRAIEAVTDPVHIGAAWNRRQFHVLAVVTAGAVAIGALQVSVVAHAGAIDTNAGLLSPQWPAEASPPVPVRRADAAWLDAYPIGHRAWPLRTAHPHLGPAPGTALSLALLFLIGAATGPADAVEALLIAAHTPPRHSQAFAALTTANWSGFAAGSAFAGLLIDRVATTAGFIAAATATLLAAASLLLVPSWRRRTRTIRLFRAARITPAESAWRRSHRGSIRNSLCQATADAATAGSKDRRAWRRWWVKGRCQTSSSNYSAPVRSTRPSTPSDSRPAVRTTGRALSLGTGGAKSLSLTTGRCPVIDTTVSEPC
ncbi:hypothetical protein [Kribbella flavida]|nr:hypothetical protein [Kribbella flavida]